MQTLNRFWLNKLFSVAIFDGMIFFSVSVIFLLDLNENWKDQF